MIGDKSPFHSEPLSECGRSRQSSRTIRRDDPETQGRCKELGVLDGRDRRCQRPATLAILPSAERSARAILDNGSNSFNSVHRPILDVGALVYSAAEQTPVAALDVAVLRSVGFSLVRL